MLELVPDGDKVHQEEGSQMDHENVQEQDRGMKSGLNSPWNGGEVEEDVRVR